MTWLAPGRPSVPPAPGDAYPLLAPALRRPFSAGFPLTLSAPRRSTSDSPRSRSSATPADGPGCRSSPWWTTAARSMASRSGTEVRGHWSTAPAFVAGHAARPRAPAGAPMSDPTDDAFLELQREYLDRAPRATRRASSRSRAPFVPGQPGRRRRSRRVSTGSQGRADPMGFRRSVKSPGRRSCGWPRAPPASGGGVEWRMRSNACGDPSPLPAPCCGPVDALTRRSLRGR